MNICIYVGHKAAESLSEVSRPDLNKHCQEVLFPAWKTLFDPLEEQKKAREEFEVKRA